VAPVEDVVLALRPAREASDAIELPQRFESLGTAGEQLVGIGLVAGVPHDSVARRVHDPMQSQRQLDGPQRAGQVPARLADRPDHLGSQLVGQLFQLVRRHPAQLGGIVERVENRHSFSLIWARESISRCSGRA
jgi:hypothetical protein